MSLFFTIPQLRRGTTSFPTVVTVPGGQTWLVKHISNTTVGGVATSVTIGGNIFSLAFVHPTFFGYNTGRPFGSMTGNIILNAGDKITFAGGQNEYAYWILETDFGLNVTIPNLRKQTIVQVNPGTYTVIVPAGETWVLKILHHDFTCPAVVVDSYIFLDIGINSFYALLFSPNNNTGNSAGSVIPESFILNAGDDIKLQLFGGGGGSWAATVEIGYWILEQDF